MSKSTNGLRKAGLASLAVTLTLGAGALGAGAANADADFEFTRIAGDNRYETAATVADTYATATTDEVILVNGEAGYYADALTANYLSGVRKAPILLTRDEFMPAATKTALADLDPAKVTIVGGTGVVPEDQADWLESEGYTVERFAGANRFETNVEVIEAGGATTKDTGIVATGFDFADALGAGPAVYQGRPLGLSKSDDIDDAIVDALDASGVTKIVVLGGESVVGQEVVDELEDAGFTVTRVDGADRSETSTEFADYAIANFGFSNKAADVASGYTLGSGADALAGGPLTGERNRPMLITKNLDNPGDLVNWLEAHAATLEEGVIYGGYGAVTASAEDRMEAAARSVSSNQDYTATPAEEATNEVSTSLVDNTGRRAYSVSGLTAGEKYEVALVNADTVTNNDGTVTFSSWTLTDGATIELVNGQSTGGNATGAAETRQETATATSDGTVTFAVDSDTADQVIPVIFKDAGTTPNGKLDLNAQGEPTEDFAIAGQKNWVPTEAANGTSSPTVGSVNRNQDYFLAGGATYYYDSNDLFRIQSGKNLTMTEFENLLTAGDVLSVNYDRDAADSSVFEVVTDVVPSPTNVKAAMSDLDGDGTKDDATITWTRSTQPDAVYNVYIDNTAGGTANKFDSTDTLVAETTGTSVTVNNADGKTYHVGAEGSTSGAVSTGDSSVTAATPGATTLAVVDNGSFVETNTGNTATATSGDVWKLVTDNDIVLDNPGLVVDGQVIEQGVNANFTASGNVLTVTLTSNVAGVSYPGVISAATGIESVDGEALTYSNDNSIEDNGPEFMADLSEVTSATTITLEFNEALLPASVNADCSDFIVDADASGGATAATDDCSAAAVSADGRTVTLTGTGFTAATTVAVDGSLVDTDGQVTSTQAADTLG